MFIRLIPDRPPVIEKELHKEEQNEDGSFCIHFSASDTDIPRAAYMYEAKLYNAENTEICTFIGGGKYKPRFIVREEQNIPKEAKGQRKLNVQCFSSRKKGSKASLEAQESKRRKYENPV